MLSSIIPVLIITLSIFHSVATDITDEILPNEISDNYLLVRPGENISISFLINCHLLEDEYNGSIDIPVPEIYTTNYFNNTYYNLSTEEKTYKYLTCDKSNISIEKPTIIYVNYTFAPPKNEYNNSTVFFVQNIDDKVLYLGNTPTDKTEVPFYFLLISVIIPVILLTLPNFVKETVHRRRQHQYDLLARNNYLESIENEYILSYYLRIPNTYSNNDISSHEPKKEVPTVFKCKKENEVREFVKGNGLFEAGIKKFKVPAFEDQVKMINKMPEVEEFFPESLNVTVNLNEYGKYFLQIRQTPIAHRIEDDKTLSYRNPYIHSEHFSLCLGTGEKLYNSCYANKNYVECIRVLCKVLKSEHGTGFRKWSECGL